MSPFVCLSSEPIMFSSVDFPHPDGPMMAVIVCGLMFSDMLSIASVSFSLV